MFSHMSVHPSICLSQGGLPWPGPAGEGEGGTPARSSQGVYYCQGGYPCWGEGYPCGGTPTRGYPIPGTHWSDLAEGLPLLGIPHLRYPLSDLAGGTPAGGVPHLRYPLPVHTWPGGSTLARGYHCQGVTPPRVPPVRPGPGVPCQGRGYPTSGNRWSTWYAAVGMPPCIHAGELSCFKVEYQEHIHLTSNRK